jgi:hypothetical protein
MLENQIIKIRQQAVAQLVQQLVGLIKNPIYQFVPKLGTY